MATAHPDELVRRIFAAQQEADPDGDPGDLAIVIEVQDDMPLVTIGQHRLQAQGDSFAAQLVPAGAGGSIQEALEAMARKVGVPIEADG